MAAVQASLLLTDHYRAQQLQVRDQTTAVLVGLWRLRPAVDAAALAAFLPPSVAALSLGQRLAASLSAAYLPRFVASETGTEHLLPHGIDTASYAGQTRDGRPLAEALGQALVKVQQALYRRLPAEQAAGVGLAHVLRLSRLETAQAGRAALGDGMVADQQVTGWVRVTNGNPCGACLALAGQFEPDTAPVEIHSSCQCSAEPVVLDVPDRYPRLTGMQMFDQMDPEQQDALFHGRGGAAKAELLRNGAVTLPQLITRQSTFASGDFITETSLADLAA